MKVTVLGAGVIGITSAYYLAKAGHEVTVVERRAGPGLETSFANAGEVSPGYASPWPARGVPAKALRWLLMRHAPLILRPKADPEMLAWLLATLRNCTEARYRVNKSRMVRLATYSRDLLIDLRRETGIAYDAGQGGTLQLFRTARQMEGVAKDAEVLAREGVAFEVLDRAGCEAVEPGLAGSADSIAGGLRLPGDETGDCYKFTVALARRLEAMGAAFLYDTPVAGLRADNGRIRAVQTGRGDIEGDVVLACLGSYTPALLRPLGIRAPIYPVKGYSITVPVQDAGRAPVSTLLDETYKVAITRLGDRIRVGGMAEVSGFDAALPEGRRATLEHCLRSLFPGAGDPAAATFWSGLRPMTPDGPPVLGGTPIANLYVNSGHGTLGWTMACGSGRVVADLIGGAPSAIRTDDLSLARYR